MSDGCICLLIFQQFELAQAALNFPYAGCIEKINTLKAISVPGESRKTSEKQYQIAMTKIGAILDQGDPEIQSKLVQLIQTRGETISLVSCSPSRPPNSLSSSDVMETDEISSIAMYTIRLNEWGAQKRKNMQYDPRHLSLDPPRWEVKINVEGQTYTGRAKTQKLAMHIAAKQAVEELRIDM